MSECPRQQDKPYIPLLSPYGDKTGPGIFEIIGGLIMAEQCGFIMTEDKKSFLSYE
jgi:hypothetical protein